MSISMSANKSEEERTGRIFSGEIKEGSDGQYRATFTLSAAEAAYEKMYPINTYLRELSEVALCVFTNPEDGYTEGELVARIFNNSPSNEQSTAALNAIKQHQQKHTL